MEHVVFCRKRITDKGTEIAQTLKEHVWYARRPVWLEEGGRVRGTEGVRDSMLFV